MKTRVLFASNGARPARDAGILLRRLADPALVEVTVNICDSVEFAFAEEPWSLGVERISRLQPAEVAEIEVAAFRTDGFDVEKHIGSGVPAQQILERTKEGNFDIILLGAGSSSWLGNLLLGSTSTKVLHAAEKSVLIVHRFQEGRGKVQVMLATDGSEDAGVAVDVFLGFADPKKAAVKVISVAEFSPAASAISTRSNDKPAGYGESAAKEKGETVAARLEERGFDVQTEYPTGEPVKEILKRGKNASLVVVGSRGLGRTGRLVMGSVSDQVARLAPATLISRGGRPGAAT